MISVFMMAVIVMIKKTGYRWYLWLPGERLLGPDSPELLGGACAEAEGPLAGLGGG